ncbi:MAG TPA: amidohydrolase family protein [Thermoanaerobaculia bacterium]|nr:amidohydrolase family protein [Thermoanaerobaculia bacterium]
MKVFLKTTAGVVLVVVLLFALGVLWPEEQLAAPRTLGPLVIRDVAIVDVRAGAVVPSQSVLVEHGRIRAVGTIGIPPHARVIDGRGRFLMPALWDMHTHVYAVTPLLDLPLYIAYGVTNVRDLQGCPTPDDPFAACAEDKRRWTAEALTGARIGPRIVASTSWMANGPGMVQRLGDVPAYFDTATPEQARQFVRHFAPTVDAIKVYDRIPRAAYFALVDEAKRLGIDVVGHRPRSVSAREAVAHQKSIEHARFLLQESFPGRYPQRSDDRRRMLDEHDPALAQEIFAAMVQHGTWYVPTHLTRWSDAYANDASVRNDPLLRYLHPLMKRQWLEDLDELIAEDPSPAARATDREFHRKGLELTGAAHRAGVKVLAGTDYIVAGADLHRELLQLRAAGLSNADVLRSATLLPAQYFALDDRYGSIAQGYVADLLLLDANPLADVRNTQRIAGVVFDGHYYDRAALDAIARLVERRARSWTIGCKIVWRFLKNPGGY